jgi:hypothetical protein
MRMTMHKQTIMRYYGAYITTAFVENGICVRSLITNRVDGFVIENMDGSRPHGWEGASEEELISNGYRYGGVHITYYDDAGNEYYRTADGVFESDPEGPVYNESDVELVVE